MEKTFAVIKIFIQIRASLTEASWLQLLKPLCVLFIYIYLGINRIFFLRQKA